MSARLNMRSVAGMAVMVSAAGLALLARPTQLLADSRGTIDLERMVPETIGEWRLEKEGAAGLVSPARKAAIDAIYAQTLSRVYVNRRGERIMLAMAYGKDQSDSFQVHLPEGCYQGQGFGVNELRSDSLATSYGTVPIERMVAVRQTRTEPVTYWITVGDSVVRNSWDMKKVKMAYAARRTIPDGLLVRVSNITRDKDAGYAAQDEFLGSLLRSVDDRGRRFLAPLEHGT